MIYTNGAYMPVIRTSNGAEDLASRMLRDRIVFLNGEVNEAMADSIMAQLLYLESEDSTKDIFLYINSPGGCVISGLAIYDTMNFIKPDVRTIVTGMAASMGAFLLSSGVKGKRMALPNAQIMIHQVSSGARGHVEDMNVSVAHSNKLNKLLFEIMGKNLGICPKKLLKMSNRDVWLDSKQAMALGVIDEIKDKRV